MSIGKEPSIPTPVDPKNPEANYAAALPGCPFTSRQIPNPIPPTMPTPGISFATVLARAFGHNILSMTRNSAFKAAGARDASTPHCRSSCSLNVYWIT